MSNELVQTGFFDLELDTPQKTWHIGLEDKLQDTLRQRAAKIKAVVAQANFIIGEELATAQKELTYKNGGFVRWLEEEVGIDFQRAYEFIQIWENYKMFPLSGNISGIGKKVLLASAKKDVPQSAREEIVTRHEAGEKITLALSDEIIERHKAEVEAANRRAETAEQQALFFQKEAELVKSDRDGLRYQLEHLPTPEPEKVMVYQDSPQTQAKIASLEQQVKKEESSKAKAEKLAKEYEERFRTTQVSNQKFAEENRKLSEEAKRSFIEGRINLDQLRVRQEWRNAVEKFLGDTTGFMARVPTLINREAFEADDWSRYSQCLHVVEQTLALLKSVQANQTSQVVEA